MKPNKILIAYASRTGNTENWPVAERVRALEGVGIFDPDG
jgi:flavodoxin